MTDSLDLEQRLQEAARSYARRQHHATDDRVDLVALVVVISDLVHYEPALARLILSRLDGDPS